MTESSSEKTYGDSKATWENSLLKLKQGLDKQIFEAYIAPLKLSSIENDLVEIVAPSNFVRNHVSENFKSELQAAIGAQLGQNNLKLSFKVDNSQANEDRDLRSSYVVVKKLPDRPAAKRTNNASSGSLNPKYTFENFVVGNSNQFCHAAAMRVAESPGESYNPLFIYGGVGLGKTHLLHAIGNCILAKRPSAKVAYMSSEAFTNDLIKSLRNAKMEQFKNRMRSIEVLLIDDIQFMCGKERTQEEFFHTFNSLYANKHQIVITSDKIPQEIPGIEERLQTRFSWGLTADLQAPDFETRVAISNRKAALDGFELPEEVSHFIAEKVFSNVRELEGAITRLHAVSSIQNMPITLELAQSSLRKFLQPKNINISVDDIKRVVAAKYNIKVSEMVSKRRTKNLSFPRHIAMYLCRKHTTCSYPEIGSHFGNRDHSSVIHAANVVTTKLKTDLELQDSVTEIEKELTETW
ncbi:MAG: chromosomal replication initiator protein DnaA [Bdellovibrionota bacterium]